MRLALRTRLSLPWYACFDDIENQNQGTDQNQDTDQNQNKEPPENTGKKKSKAPTFSAEQQAYYNSSLAEERRKAQKKNDELILQFETMKNHKATTEAERDQYQEKIEQLKAEYQTKDVNEKKETDRKIKELETRAKKAESDREKWQRLFTEDRIKSAIITAATQYKAHKPGQIYAMLRPNTRLEQAVGEDGKPIEDQWIEKVDFMGVDKDNKPTKMLLTVTEAVKQMTEMTEEHGNLFNSGSTGGLGAFTQNGKSTSQGGPPKDAASYMEWRKKSGNVTQKV